jgi:hypothetical protein
MLYEGNRLLTVYMQKKCYNAFVTSHFLYYLHPIKCQDSFADFIPMQVRAEFPTKTHPQIHPFLIDQSFARIEFYTF